MTENHKRNLNYRLLQHIPTTTINIPLIQLKVIRPQIQEYCQHKRAVNQQLLSISRAICSIGTQALTVLQSQQLSYQTPNTKCDNQFALAGNTQSPGDAPLQS